MNTKRGNDSAGLGWVEKSGVVIEKVAQNPMVAFTMTLNGGLIRAAKSGTCIGHTRAATTGKVNNANAHPFLLDGVAWAHNGIISNPEKFGTYQVDSEALIHGIKARDFSGFVGSIALLWLEAGLVRAYRFGNPLFRGLKDGGVYFASESAMLNAVGCKRIRELSAGIVYTFAGASVRDAKRVKANKVYESIACYPTYQREYMGTFNSVPDGRVTHWWDEEKHWSQMQAGNGAPKHSAPELAYEY
jgi:glutamine phosphoribosylpyrophosphate amidotransferase